MSTIKVDTYQTRGGASEIAIDKIKGVTAAGSMLVVGEGGTNTTNLQQGLLKHFVYIQGTDTFGSGNSFNQSSATDHGTGDHSSTYTTNMGESRVPRVVYTHNTADEGSSFYSNAIRAGTHSSGKGTVAPTTSAFRFDVYYGSDKDVNGASLDLSYLYMMTCGDLA